MAKSPKTPHAKPAAARAQVDRLCELAVATNGGPATISNAASVMGLSGSGVTYYRKFGVPPEKAQALQDTLGWQAEYILHGTGEKLAAGVVPASPPETVRAAKKRIVAKRAAKQLMHEVEYPVTAPPVAPKPNGVMALYLHVTQPMKLVLADAGALSIEYKDGQTLVHIAAR